jgi:hypothetical protein
LSGQAGYDYGTMPTNLTEIENTIKTWPHPWPELLGLYQRFRDESLDHALNDDERKQATDEYRERLLRMITER